MLLNGFWLVHDTGHAEEAQVTFDPESYVGQMLTLFKTSELMEDIWIDYIQKPENQAWSPILSCFRKLKAAAHRERVE